MSPSYNSYSTGGGPNDLVDRDALPRKPSICDGLGWDCRLPQDVLFATDPRLSEKGFVWRPKNFPNLSYEVQKGMR